MGRISYDISLKKKGFQIIEVVKFDLNYLPKVHVDNKARAFRDIHGSMLMLHGVNVVVKSKPFLPNLKENN